MGALDRTYPKNRSMNERRLPWRYPFDMDASIWPKQGSSQAVKIHDLSVAGDGVVVTREVPVGQTGVLRIDFAQGASLRLPYKVLWYMTINGLKRAGLRLFMIESLKLQLANFIDGATGG